MTASMYINCWLLHRMRNEMKYLVERMIRSSVLFLIRLFLTQEHMSKRICNPVFYGDLVYKIMRGKDTTNFLSSGSKNVKVIKRRHYDPLFIGMTIGLVLGPSTSSYIAFLKHCPLKQKSLVTGLVHTSSEVTKSRPLSLLIASQTPSSIRP